MWHQKVSSDFDKKGIQELYQQLMSMSRKLQYQQLVKAGALGRLPFIEIDSLGVEKARVVFQGMEGAYGQAAMKTYFGEDCNSYSVRTFRDAMEAIEEGAADYAVLPIENSTAGAVNEVYDLLVEFENYIVGEVIIPITHTLAGLPGTQLSELKRVYSKAEALMQTTRFWKNTVAGSRSAWQIQLLQQRKSWMTRTGLRRQSAVPMRQKVYGLEVLEDNINDESGNCTRFIIVTNQKVFLKGAKKISICFEVPHESGSLYHLLSHFIYNDLNMSKIESRPIEGRSWEYRFFVDFEGNLEEPGVKNAL